MNLRTTLSATGTGIAALTLVALSAGAAAAHVTVTPDTSAAGSYAVLTFSVGHGCEGSPTTELAIALPESIPQVTPTVNPNWTVKKVSEKLTEPITDSHGNEVTERISQVVYTARTPLEDGFRDTVELSLQLPEAAGETLTFPVIQTCVTGETAWTETAAEGQDADALAEPAPSITLSAATGGGHHGEEEAAPDTNADTEPAAAQDSTEDGNGLAIGALIAGIAGIVIGGLALARGRKRV